MIICLYLCKLQITQGVLGLDKSFYLNQTNEKNKETIKIYKGTIVKVIDLLFGPVNNSNQTMENILELETKIAKIMCKLSKNTGKF